MSEKGRKMRIELVSTVKTNSGQYIGNSSQNRAIPHGLGKKPKSVIIYAANATAYAAMSIHDMSKMIFIAGAVYEYISVTEADNTNFYVGNSAPDFRMNFNGITYNWVVHT